MIHVSTTLWQQNQPSYQDKSHMRESLAERKPERLMSVRFEFDWGVKLMRFCFSKFGVKIIKTDF